VYLWCGIVLFGMALTIPHLVWARIGGVETAEDWLSALFFGWLVGRNLIGVCEVYCLVVCVRV